jgi:hypothetical protein
VTCSAGGSAEADGFGTGSTQGNQNVLRALSALGLDAADMACAKIGVDGDQVAAEPRLGRVGEGGGEGGFDELG